MHLGIILVNNQLGAQFFFHIYLFRFFTCFEHPCVQHQKHQLYQYDIWYLSLYVGDRPVWRFGRNIQTCTLDGHLHRVTYQMSYWYNWFSWWSAQGRSKHVENSNKYIRKKKCAPSWLFTRIKFQGSSAEEIGGALPKKSISWFCEILDSNSGVAAGYFLTKTHVFQYV